MEIILLLESDAINNYGSVATAAVVIVIVVIIIVVVVIVVVTVVIVVVVIVVAVIVVVTVVIVVAVIVVVVVDLMWVAKISTLLFHFSLFSAVRKPVFRRNCRMKHHPRTC
ncbi:putative [Brugia malayi]|uniref:Bm12035 n=2 Tax=Brugia TaxID=6278 RepID=A0A0K0ITD5_BRUMA|nr:uncharacterized protein BM_BM12035 [Brugia malayi]CDQ07700.1 Bm12035 [Brugia malayi]VDO34757.1 unnamed protein product [Brugia timori]VIO92848.1 putative [Brugia malayi]